jgi:hypothetical protein
MTGSKRSINLARLLGMGPRADREIEVRLWNFQFTEENIGHVLVMVLTGVYQRLPNSLTRRQSARQRGYLHEVGPRAHHV